MTDIWDRLERMCCDINPSEPRGGLQPPATIQQLAAVEAITGRQFPDDLRQAYLRFNGMGSNLRGFKLFPRWFGWIGVADPPDNGCMHDAWRIMLHIIADDRADNPDFDSDVEASRQWVEEDRRPVFYEYQDPSRILVAWMGTEDGVFVDTRPPTAGTPGQLIYADPMDPGASFVIAPSFTQAIEWLVRGYESGQIRFDGDGEGWIWADSGKLLDWEGLSQL